MKHDDVRVGSQYMAKVSGRVVPVKVVRKHPNGGWFAVNLISDRTVTLASAQLTEASSRRAFRRQTPTGGTPMK